MHRKLYVENDAFSQWMVLTFGPLRVLYLWSDKIILINVPALFNVHSVPYFLPSTGDVAASASVKPVWPKGIMSMKAVHAILGAHGVTDVTSVSKCLKAGILHGNVKLLKPEDDPRNDFGLDQVGLN